MKDFLEIFKDKVIEWFSGLTKAQQADVIAGLDAKVLEDEPMEDTIEYMSVEFLYEDLSEMIERNCASSYGWDKKEVVREILEESMDDYKSYGFFDDFIDDISYNIEGYSSPIGFFEDLQCGGCQSGMVGMFIYHSDCKNFYINYIDDLENFKRELENEIGETIQNTQDQPHYTFVCWLVYEEFANIMARRLFPNNF